ncbi:MAG: ABC transporter permease [Acidobacteriia bacterium]|nr:ABC transporter permease [Terriglobia bacterium]
MWIRLRNKLRFLFQRDRFDRELAEEMDFHRAMIEADKARQGLAPEDAAAGARRQLGNTTLAGESSRDAWIIAWLDTFCADVRYAWRMSRRQPGLTLVAILSLALGIGAAAATWSLLYAVLLHPLPVQAPERLVVVGMTNPPQRGGGARPLSTNFIYPEYSALRQTGAFDGLAAGGSWSLLVATDGLPQPGIVYFASHDYFDTLGIHIPLGRNFASNEDRRGAPLVAIVSDRFWHRALYGNPNVVGRTITIARKQATVIGVAPRGFRGLNLAQAPDVYMPLNTAGDVGEPGINFFADPTPPASSPTAWVRIVGRLRTGVTAAQTAARLDSQRFAGNPRKPAWFAWILTDVNTAAIPEAARAGMAQFTQLLGTTVGLLLLIGCLSVGMLLLIRTEARSDEFAMRLALGANRARFARGIAIEGALLSLAGAALALPVTQWLFDGLRTFQLPGGIDIDFLELSIDARVLTGAACGAVAASMVIALVAGLFGFSANVADVLRSRAGATPRLTRRRTRAVLVTAQVAVTLVLLTGAGLFARSLIEALRLNPGFETRRIVTGSVSLAPYGYNTARAASFFDDLQGRLGGNPAISALSMAAYQGGMTSYGKLTIDGVARQFPTTVTFYGVDEHYFSTMGMRVIQGRDFSSDDAQHAPPVTIVSESFASMLATGGDPIGRRITEPSSRKGQPNRVFQVIGAVPDVITDVETLNPLVMYLPMAQNPAGASHGGSATADAHDR